MTTGGKGRQVDQIWFGGGLMTFVLTSEATGGALAIAEDIVPRGKTTPLHLHASFDEIIYVVSGEILVHLDGEEVTVSAGEAAVAPRATPHAFLVTSDSAHLLAIATPGDVWERFMREGGEAVTSPELDPPPLDIERVRGAGMKTGGMEVLGPPPFATASASTATS